MSDVVTNKVQSWLEDFLDRLVKPLSLEEIRVVGEFIEKQDAASPLSEQLRLLDVIFRIGEKVRADLGLCGITVEPCEYEQIQTTITASVIEALHPLMRESILHALGKINSYERGSKLLPLGQILVDVRSQLRVVVKAEMRLDSERMRGLLPVIMKLLNFTQGRIHEESLVAQATISNLLNGKRISHESLTKLAEWLRTKKEELEAVPMDSLTGEERTILMNLLREF